MKNILIFGGAGYIGACTTRHLLEHGYSCIVADNLSCGHRQAVSTQAKFIHADMQDLSSLKSIFKSHKIDAVMLFAAYTRVEESVQDPAKYYQNNIIGTLNLLNTMLDFGVKKLIFSSTCATYGDPQYIPLDERHPQAPINPYGATKLFAEQIFADYARAYDLEYISLRYFNAAGAMPGTPMLGASHEQVSHLIPLIFKAIKGEIEHLKIYGNDYETPDGTGVRDYIHVEDLASAHRLACEKLGTYCGGLNIGTGVGTSVLQMVRAAEEITGKKCPVVFAPRRAGDPAMLYADNKKAMQILGWQVKYKNIKDILQTAWDWENNRWY